MLTDDETDALVKRLLAAHTHEPRYGTRAAHMHYGALRVLALAAANTITAAQKKIEKLENEVERLRGAAPPTVGR